MSDTIASDPEASTGLELGVSVHESLLTPDGQRRRSLLGTIAESGLDHVTVGDHISFHGGTGFDGLISAASVLAASDRLSVLVGVYQLALRHPMVAARQLATLSQMAPGRLVLGVGVGGEDRSEVSNCGVDPATRGRRLDESLGIMRRLATGEAVDHEGEFFTLESAAVLPAPSPQVPIVIGGGGDAAVRRTARYGDGWLGIFCTARRFGETRQRILEAAEETGRAPSWFGLSIWCGFDEDEESARSLLGARMESLYRLPHDKFRHLTAAGRPEQVAEQLGAYVEAGARNITIVPVGRSDEAAVEQVAQVRQLLRGAVPAR